MKNLASIHVFKNTHIHIHIYYTYIYKASLQETVYIVVNKERSHGSKNVSVVMGN